MNEIVIRRSFLDRRSCVESTHQLKFEEDQEVILRQFKRPQLIEKLLEPTHVQHYPSAYNSKS
jgi:hypothetical protein